MRDHRKQIHPGGRPIEPAQAHFDAGVHPLSALLTEYALIADYGHELLTTDIRFLMGVRFGRERVCQWLHKEKVRRCCAETLHALAVVSCG